jgi:hypothetical protein
MSPEQVIGKRADHRSDIFSLGVILYEMLAGAAPFNGENVTALMYQIVNFVPPPPSQIKADLPQLVDYIVAKMLAKPLEDRYQDAAEAARDLRECERQATGAGGAPAATMPGATAAQPQLVPPELKTVVLAQTVNRTREDDGRTTVEPTAPAVQGLAPSFDSLEATQRLAHLTGTTTPAIAVPETHTQVIKSMPAPPEGQGWRRRDWLLVGAAAVLGLMVAFLKVLR